MKTMRELIEGIPVVKVDKARDEVERLVDAYAIGMKGALSNYESGKRRLVDMKSLMMAMAKYGAAIGFALADVAGDKSKDIARLSRDLDEIGRKVTRVQVKER